jgi:hypothetical protein
VVRLRDPLLHRHELRYARHGATDYPTGECGENIPKYRRLRVYFHLHGRNDAESDRERVLSRQRSVLQGRLECAGWRFGHNQLDQRHHGAIR